MPVLLPAGGWSARPVTYLARDLANASHPFTGNAPAFWNTWAVAEEHRDVDALVPADAGNFRQR